MWLRSLLLWMALTLSILLVSLSPVLCFFSLFLLQPVCTSAIIFVTCLLSAFHHMVPGMALFPPCKVLLSLLSGLDVMGPLLFSKQGPVIIVIVSVYTYVLFPVDLNYFIWLPAPSFLLIPYGLASFSNFQIYHLSHLSLLQSSIKYASSLWYLHSLQF